MGGRSQDGGQGPVANHPTADVPNPGSVVGVLGRETDNVGRGLGIVDEKGQNPGINLGGLVLSLAIGKVKGKRKNLVKKMRSKKKRSKKRRSNKKMSKKKISLKKKSSAPSL